MSSIRAIYHKGQLRLMEKVDLAEGQEVQIQILERPHRFSDAIRDLLIGMEDMTEEIAAYDDEAIQRSLDEALQGKGPLSEIIIADRHEG
ncbi:MAG: antitoxin family protein [Anaerolineae bacterium]|nr:antitoxin family protein [Anaerolineae bacterium]